MSRDDWLRNWILDLVALGDPTPEVTIARSGFASRREVGLEVLQLVAAKRLRNAPELGRGAVGLPPVRDGESPLVTEVTE
jgi:hypothetical protein